MLYFAPMTIMGEVLTYYPYENPNTCDYLSSILFVLISIFGTALLYKSNGGSSGRKFITRFFSIGWVLIVRFLPSLVLIIISLSACYEVFEFDYEDISTKW